LRTKPVDEINTLGWPELLAVPKLRDRAPLPFLLWVTAVREAVARLLPSAGIGGEIVGIRLCRRRIADTEAVSATVIVEVLITMAGQGLFCALRLLADLQQLRGIGRRAQRLELGEQRLLLPHRSVLH